MTLPLFQNGFRPFFLGGALFAGLAVPLWAGLLTQLIPAADPLLWHAHEMVFGFFTAILGGFLLTAMPSWTNRPPLRGRGLQVLFGAWVVGRVAMTALLWGHADPVLLGGLDLLYPVLLTLYAAREVTHAPAIHNFPVVVMVGLLTVADSLFHLAAIWHLDPLLGPHLGLAAAAALMALIGGRVIPNFTRNWLAQRLTVPLPAAFGKLDVAAVVLTVGGMLAWVFVPAYAVTPWLLAAASLVGAVRLSRWRGRHTVAEPLLFILHVGYGWLVAALALLALNGWWPHAGAMHGLTAGAMGVMILAIMTRATRGHTGNPLTADRVTVAIYGLVNAGAVIRVAAGYLPWDYTLTAVVGGLVWSAAFLLFALSYGRLLLGSPK